MNTVLIVGVDSVVGANCAVVFGEKFRVVGVAQRTGVRIEDCEIRTLQRHDAASVRKVIQQEQPLWVVFCGAAAQSSWDLKTADCIDDAAAIAWAQAAQQAGSDFTMVSSDAVFTGPWVSHNEADENYCQSPRACHIREIEDAVFTAHPEALVVRTNVIGWSAQSRPTGFVEQVLASFDQQTSLEIDFVRHGSPVLASDFADMLLTAYDNEVCGMLHLSGGERVNPFQLVELLAEAADLAPPEMPTLTTLAAPVTGFGLGETTLNCALARELIGIQPPLIDDSIRSLMAQRVNGFCDKLRAATAELSKVA